MGGASQEHGAPHQDAGPNEESTTIDPRAMECVEDMQRTIPPPPPNNGDPYDADLLIWAFSNAPEGMFGEVTESEREARRKAKAVEVEKEALRKAKKSSTPVYQ